MDSTRYFGRYNSGTGRCDEYPAPRRMPPYPPIVDPPTSISRYCAPSARTDDFTLRRGNAGRPRRPRGTCESDLEADNRRFWLDPLRILDEKRILLYEALLKTEGSAADIEEEIQDVENARAEQIYFREFMSQWPKEQLEEELGGPPGGWNVSSDGEEAARNARTTGLKLPATKEKITTRSGRVVNKSCGRRFAQQSKSSTTTKNTKRKPSSPPASPPPSKSRAVARTRKCARTAANSVGRSSLHGKYNGFEDSTLCHPIVDPDETEGDDGYDHEVAVEKTPARTRSNKRLKHITLATLDNNNAEDFMAVAVPSSTPVRDDGQASVKERRSISVNLKVEDAAVKALAVTGTRAERQSIRSRLRQAMEY